MTKNIVYLNPIPIERTQKPDLCPTATIAQEAQRRGIFSGSLETLAVKIKQNVSSQNEKMYGKALRRRSLPKKDAQIGLTFERAYDLKLQEIIKKELQGLTMTPYKIGDITGESIHEMREQNYDITKARKKVIRFLLDNLSSNNGVGINYRLDPFNGRNDGHYVLGFAFHKNTKNLYVCDSSFLSPEYWKEPLDTFINAMRPIWKEDDNSIRQRGFIVLSGPMLAEKQSKKEIKKILMNTPKYEPINARIVQFPSHPEDRKTPYTPKKTKNENRTRT